MSARILYAGSYVCVSSSCMYHQYFVHITRKQKYSYILAYIHTYINTHTLYTITYTYVHVHKHTHTKRRNRQTLTGDGDIHIVQAGVGERRGQVAQKLLYQRRRLIGTVFHVKRNGIIYANATHICISKIRASMKNVCTCEYTLEGECEYICVCIRVCLCGCACVFNGARA